MFTPEKLVASNSTIMFADLDNKTSVIEDNVIERPMGNDTIFKNNQNFNRLLNQSDINMARALQANSLVQPQLNSIERPSIKAFIASYEQYRIMCPQEFTKTPQYYVHFHLLEVVASASGYDIEDLMLVGADTFFAHLCALHEALTVFELEKRLRKVIMTTDDLSISTLIKYNQAWKLERMMAWSKVTIPERYMTKIFVASNST